MNLDKNLRETLCGLSVEELGKLINMCCLEGQRIDTKLLLRLRHSSVDHITWKYKTSLGINLKFVYIGILNGMMPDLELSGKGWSLKLSGIIHMNALDKNAIKIGPIYITDDTPVEYKIQYVYRRGNINKFKHDMSLLRMML